MNQLNFLTSIIYIFWFFFSKVMVQKYLQKYFKKYIYIIIFILWLCYNYIGVWMDQKAISEVY